MQTHTPKETALAAALKKAGVIDAKHVLDKTAGRNMPLENFLRWFRFNIDKARAAGRFHHESYTVTKDIADYLMKNHNEGNRHIDTAEVNLIADILRKGEFKYTSQGISFSDETPTRFNNGQHRVEAIRQTGISAMIDFCFGESRENFAVIDANMKTRNAVDVVRVAMPELQNAKLVTAAALLYVRVAHNSEKTKLTPQEHLDVLRELPTLEDHAKAAQKIGLKLGGGSTRVATAVALAVIARDMTCPGDDFETFVEELREGYGLAKKSPVLLLRNMMTTGRLGGEYKGRTKAMAIVYGILTAWNTEREGKPGSMLRLNAYEKGVPFPKVK
jgi:hypothetical protein